MAEEQKQTEKVEEKKPKTAWGTVIHLSPRLPETNALQFGATKYYQTDYCRKVVVEFCPRINPI